MTRLSPAPSRRSLVRAAGGAAWAAPLVSIAAAAPAAAATSPTTGPTVSAMQVLSAGYWVLSQPGTRTCVVPAITWHNLTSSVVSALQVSLSFPTSRFVGVYADPSGGPALPGVVSVGAGPGPGWSAPSLAAYAATSGAPPGVVVTVTLDVVGAGATVGWGEATQSSGIGLIWRTSPGTQDIAWTWSIGSDPTSSVPGELTYLTTSA